MPKTPLTPFLARIKDRAAVARSSLARPEHLEASVILLLTPIVLTLWVYQGKRDSFARLFAGFQGPWPADVYSTLYEYLAAFLLMFGVPALLSRLLLKRSVGENGLQLGDVHQGLRMVGVGLPFALLIAYLAAKDPSIRAEYPLAKGAMSQLGLLLLVEACYLLYYLGWEFLFRGFMLSGLQRHYGPLVAILIQTIPSTLVHIGKPYSENWAALIAGIILGYIAVRTRSIFYPMLLHAVVGIGTDVFIALGAL
jgi:membrane protease YdiL (CAAX protease family)